MFDRAREIRLSFCRIFPRELSIERIQTVVVFEGAPPMAQYDRCKSGPSHFAIRPSKTWRRRLQR